MNRKQPEFFVAEQPRRPDDIKPGEYHWSKLRQPEELLKGLQANPLVTVIGPAIDHEGDTVGFWYYAPSKAAARRAIERAMGDDHGLFTMEMSTSYRLHGGLAQERARRKSWSR